jgi:hypothetical protein
VKCDPVDPVDHVSNVGHVDPVGPEQGNGITGSVDTGTDPVGPLYCHKAESGLRDHGIDGIGGSGDDYADAERVAIQGEDAEP